MIKRVMRCRYPRRQGLVWLGIEETTGWCRFSVLAAGEAVDVVSIHQLSAQASLTDSGRGRRMMNGIRRAEERRGEERRERKIEEDGGRAGRT